MNDGAQICCVFPEGTPKKLKCRLAVVPEGKCALWRQLVEADAVLTYGASGCETLTYSARNLLSLQREVRIPGFGTVESQDIPLPIAAHEDCLAAAGLLIALGEDTKSIGGILGGIFEPASE